MVWLGEMDEVGGALQGGFCGSSDLIKGTPIELFARTCSIESCLSCSLTSQEKKSRLENVLEKRREEGTKSLIAEDVLKEEDEKSKEGLLQRRRKGPQQLHLRYERNGGDDIVGRGMHHSSSTSSFRRDLSLEPLSAKELLTSNYAEAHSLSLPPEEGAGVVVTPPSGLLPLSARSHRSDGERIETDIGGSSDRSYATAPIVYACPL
eukprot:CAMPEP_0113908620 /NCGR_PEP_ID=MMETSP0780_2-20120614/26285_1 /TAXON_ID=652834 /ORGANISM="Palpitomonas bilix" /LENGTH=206 /DNA_ID=CAMNT_0000904113 /DNA_START=87 /DNA_END=704 /DNA_ORIENTATION=+ /assembly_acc=CAM_ASM_000599